MWLSTTFMHIQQLPSFIMGLPNAYECDTSYIFSRHYLTSHAPSADRLGHLMHIQPIQSDPRFTISRSKEAPVNDVNNPFLLLFRHLVIAGKTQPSTENIGSYVHSRALYISICAASTVALDRYERIRPVNRLHMHGLPRWSDGITTICSCLDGLRCRYATIYCVCQMG